MPIAPTPRGNMAYDANVTNPHNATVIYLHGAGMERITFGDELMETPNYNTIRLDLPNHGDSEHVGLERYQHMHDYCRDVLAFMDTLDTQQAVLCGHSMGGGVALCMALDHPERVPGAIVVNGSAQMNIQPRMISAVPGEVSRSFENTLLAAFPKLEDWLPISSADPDNESSYLQYLKVNPRVLLRDYRLCHNFNLSHRLQEIQPPILVVSGGLDLVFPPAEIRRMEASIPYATYIEFEQGGHMIPGEMPQRLVETITDWLTENNLETPLPAAVPLARAAGSD